MTDVCLTCGLRKRTHPVAECVTGFVSDPYQRFSALGRWHLDNGREQDAVEAWVAAYLSKNDS